LAEPSSPSSIPVPEPGGTDPTTVRAAAAWLNLFARTVKICRLYDAGNPTEHEQQHERCHDPEASENDVEPGDRFDMGEHRRSV